MTRMHDKLEHDKHNKTNSSVICIYIFSRWSSTGIHVNVFTETVRVARSLFFFA